MNIICKIFGHKKIVQDFYPSDPITSISCLRCNKILKSTFNIIYTGNFDNLSKMICINNDKVNLTLNETYEILYSKYTNYYFIKDDNGKLINVNSNRFETLTKNRKRKLEKLMT